MISIIAHICNQAVSLAATLVIHATCILLLGMVGLYICKRRMAYASLILRICVAAVLLTPFSSVLFLKYGVIQFHLPGIITEHRKSLSSVSSAESNQTGTPPPPAIKSTPVNNHELPVNNDLNNTIHNQNVSPPQSTAHNTTSSSIDSNTGLIPDKNQDIEAASSPIPSRVDNNKNRKSTYGFIYSILAFVWLVLSGFLMLKICLALKYINRLKNNAKKANALLEEECREYAEIIGVNPPPILISQDISSAFITGIFHPVILFPCDHPEEMGYSKEILVHELAHLSRKDTLWNMLGQAGKIMLPFHPLMWSLDKQLTITSDFICDDIVLHVTNSRRQYAEQLYKIAEEGCLMAAQATAGVGFFSVDSSFLARIERILDRHRPLSFSLQKRRMIVTVVFGSIGFISIGFVGITADSMASMPKSIIHLNTQLFMDNNRVTSSIEQKVSSIIPRSYPLDEAILPAANNTDKSSRIYDSDSEKPIITGLKRDNIRQIMESIPPDNTPIEFRIHAFDDQNFHHSTDFASSLTNESERNRIYPHHPQSPDYNHDDKAEYEYDSNMLNTVAYHQPTNPMTGIFADKAINPIDATSADGMKNTFKALDVVISTDYDYGDLSDQNRKKMGDVYRSLRKNMKYPCWSPDGRKIAFNDSDYGVWIVDADGGIPQLVYDNYYRLMYNDQRLHFGDLRTLGFTPDGREVTLRRYDIDTDMGTTVAFDYSNQVMMYSIKNPLPVIESVNIKTGESRILAESAITGCWSGNGRYFAYITVDMESKRELCLLDTITDTRSEIQSSNPSNVCFMPDTESIIVSENGPDGTGKITRLHIHSGESDELLDINNTILSDVSPDGSWILCTKTTAAARQFIYNIQSGEIRDIAPSDQAESAWGRFAPDGGKVCFNMKDNNGNWNIYTGDIQLSNGLQKEKTDETNDAKPMSFAIKGNYPNPFNMSTVIEFQIPENGFISLNVYNSLGQKVRELLSGHVEAGIHQTDWDGLDDKGSTVSTGLYIAKLNTRGHTASLKMTMMK